MAISWKTVATLASTLFYSQLAAAISPIVSPVWLKDNLNDPFLLVIDIRPEATYAASHVPGALGIPFGYSSLWAEQVEGDTLRMPPAEELLPALAGQGLSANTSVVLVSSVATMPRGMNEATRVAATLQYAGLPTNQVGILDGGYEGWIKNGGEESLDAKVPTPGDFNGPVDETVVVERPEVKASLNKVDEGIVLLDARDTASFDQGHIESALSLPQKNIWNSDGTFKTVDQLWEVYFKGVGDAPVGPDEGEIIVYCFIGLMATGWHFVLTNVLEFENVKLYDGSVQDWTKEYQLVTA
ncbi:unnamed protein product [Periconia digitata]|uniref:Rhodanese domain-containing protein n=1 Tax=Periconia digitata TaxID=1303443 RepID=A0A9W4XT02_9PLEO|nr:unnamed protein product [Periconia digitata]